jgi:hypothetical protein
MTLENYRQLLAYFDELGYPFALMEKIALKEELELTDGRRFFFKKDGQFMGANYEAIFMLVRPKYEAYFAIREYQFGLKEESRHITQVFPVGYADFFHPDRLVDPIAVDAAYNLVSGRSVYFEESGRWMKLDFLQEDSNGNFVLKQFHKTHAYDLDELLSWFPIIELGDPEHSAKLLESLKRGNRQSVTFVENGKEIKKFIEASPQFNTINVYDSQMKREILGKPEKETNRDLAAVQQNRKGVSRK